MWYSVIGIEFVCWVKMEALLFNFFIPGALLGITAALSPGPLMALLVAESMRGGLKSGAKVGISPLVTDVPFIIAAVIVAKGIESSQILLAAISFIGAGFLILLAIQNMRANRIDFKLSGEAAGSLRKGVVVNLLLGVGSMERRFALS